MVVEMTGLRLAPSAAMKEKRLAGLLAGRDAAADPALAEALVTAQVRGSLELAGKAGTPEEADAAAALRRAVFAVDAQAPLTVEAILTWQAALTGDRALRRQARDRPGGPPAAPPEFVASRLPIVQAWLGGANSPQLKSAQQGALAYAPLLPTPPLDRRPSPP